MYKKFNILNQKKKNIEYPRITPSVTEKLEEVENRIAEYLSVSHAIIVNNESSALYLAIRALELLESTEIILPALDYPFIPAACEFAGMLTGFADVNIDSFTLCPDSLKDRITGKTGAVVISSLFGLPPHLNDLIHFCRANHLKSIEMSIDGLGAVYRGQKVGTMGDIGITGFYYAGGAAILTNDSKIREKLLILRNEGKCPITGEYTETSLDFRPSYVQVMEINKLIKDIDDYLEVRYSIAKEYFEKLEKYPHLIFPPIITTATHTFHDLVARIENLGLRDKIINFIEEIGFNPHPDAKFLPEIKKIQKTYHCNPNFFPNAKKISKTFLNIPLDINKESKVPSKIEEIINNK